MGRAATFDCVISIQTYIMYDLSDLNRYSIFVFVVFFYFDDVFLLALTNRHVMPSGAVAHAIPYL